MLTERATTPVGQGAEQKPLTKFYRGSVVVDPVEGEELEEALVRHPVEGIGYDAIAAVTPELTTTVEVGKEAAYSVQLDEVVCAPQS